MIKYLWRDGHSHVSCIVAFLSGIFLGKVHWGYAKVYISQSKLLTKVWIHSRLAFLYYCIMTICTIARQGVQVRSILSFVYNTMVCSTNVYICSCYKSNFKLYCIILEQWQWLNFINKESLFNKYYHQSMNVTCKTVDVYVSLCQYTRYCLKSSSQGCTQKWEMR